MTQAMRAVVALPEEPPPEYGVALGVVTACSGGVAARIKGVCGPLFRARTRYLVYRLNPLSLSLYSRNFLCFPSSLLPSYLYYLQCPLSATKTHSFFHLLPCCLNSCTLLGNIGSMLWVALLSESHFQHSDPFIGHPTANQS